MARTFLTAVRDLMERHAMVTTGDHVLVAVSGGADSVALLLGLLDLRDALGITVTVAHLDHRLRGAESARDRAFVEALAHAQGTPCRADAVDVPAGNLEAEARRIRYAFLESIADELGVTKIATAHTRDDQAETVLLRLLHGAGRRGLGGIRPRRGRIIRPMLGCDRIQVRTFLLERGATWRRDYSNFDLGLERARVRHGFLPALTRELNPRLAATLADVADVMREEDALLDRLAAVTVRSRVLTVDVLDAIEAPLARRAIRLWWRRHGVERRLGRIHVEAIRGLAARASGDGEIAVPGGAIVREGRALHFRAGPATRAPVVPWEEQLVPGRDCATPGGWIVRLVECLRPDAPEPGDGTCVVDAETVHGPFLVRNRRLGDQLSALGLGGRTSIKRLFSSRHVPRDLRDDHPLVTTEGEVLWVPGCGRSERGLVGPATTRCWVIRLIQRPNEYA
ncbi:MAG: tRNA lysidine(34) synthetase TilS [Candidatus Binatia bacterium]